MNYFIKTNFKRLQFFCPLELVRVCFASLLVIFLKKFFIDFSFLRTLGILLHLRTKFLIIEFWLHFDLHFVLRLFTLIWTPIILNFFWSCVFVSWTISKSLFHEVFAIWNSAGSILFLRSSLWAVSYLVRKKANFDAPSNLFVYSLHWVGWQTFKKILH